MSGKSLKCWGYDGGQVPGRRAEGYTMKAVWLLVTAILIPGLPTVGLADETKQDIPFFDGKPGMKIGDVCVNPKDGAEMVWVPAGEFLMGSSDEELALLMPLGPGATRSDKRAVEKTLREKFGHEKPQRKVFLDGYWIYKYEVTVGQYRKFCAATKAEMPSAPEWGWKNDHPMVMVNWQDAVDYSTWAAPHKAIDNSTPLAPSIEDSSSGS